MRVVVAPNALKGSLTAERAALAIERGVLRAAPQTKIVRVPIADGGDGTRDVLLDACNGSAHSCLVSDPLGRTIEAAWGAIASPGRAVLDVASASGLSLLQPNERDPMRTTSYGTGELVRAALDAGQREILLGVGGSATVDGGLGILAALGYGLFDARGAALAPNGAALASLEHIDGTRAHPALAAARIEILCDVENPLLGRAGAAKVFGPQKGARDEQVTELEAGLERWARIIEKTFGRDVRALRYGGAAGGIAAGLFGALGARLCSGAERVLELVDFQHKLDGASWAITAEGRFDRQSLWHKGPIAVARTAHARGVPTWLLAGSVDTELSPVEFPELVAVRAIAGELSTAEAMSRAAELLEGAAELATREFLRS